MNDYKTKYEVLAAENAALAAERDRLRIECEAWRSGRLLLLMDTNPDPARPFYTPMFAVGDMAGSPFDTITDAVDALMAEEGE